MVADPEASEGQGWRGVVSVAEVHRRRQLASHFLA